MSIICKVTRGENLESQHVVYGVAVDEAGKIIFSTGDPQYVTCIRSSLKPFQAAASIKSGAVDAAGFSEEELALMCASHNGEEIHVKTVQSMVNKLGFTEADYECGSHAPYDKDSRLVLIRNQEEISPFHNNCSGKHAGMLALAKHLNVDRKGYTNPDHPVQQVILRQVEEYVGNTEFPIAIDGCSAPVPFLSIYSIAVLFQKLSDGKYPELERIYQAMTNHPYLIAGRNRFDTDFIESLKGRAVTKVGGEAVRGIGIRTEGGRAIGIALKVLDGSQRVNPVASIALLEYLELINKEELEKLKSYKFNRIFNHRKIHVGNITAKVEE